MIAMDLLLGYGAGLLTLINPCVLPVLPIVLAGALQSSRWGPVALAGGMSLAFVALGLGVATLGRSFGIDQDIVAQVAALMMVGFGLVLLVPRFSAGFATVPAGMAASADSQMDQIDTTGIRGQFLGGMLLGAVWSPCVGPTLGAAISLAFQGESLFWAGSIMVTFALGVSTVILALGYGARSALQRRKAWMQMIAVRARPILGGVFVIVGLGIFFGIHKLLEIWALDVLPIWLQDLSVAL